MSNDYIPFDDPGFNDWQRQFAAYVNANLSALGLTALDPDVVAINDAASDWEIKFPAHRAKQAEARAASRDKSDSRKACAQRMRRLAQRLQISPGVGDDERAGLGITRRDKIRTRPAPPNSAPILFGDTSDRMRITIRYKDGASPTRRGRPHGTRGCELWVKIGGERPGDLSDCTYLAFSTRSPHIAIFEGDEGNQTAYFIGRWLNTRGEPGPLSPTLSATIPA